MRLSSAMAAGSSLTNVGRTASTIEFSPAARNAAATFRIREATLLVVAFDVRSVLVCAAVRPGAGMNSMIDEVIRLSGHLLKGAKMVGLFLFQVIAPVPLVDKPPHRTVAAKDIFQVFRFKNKGIRLRGEEGSPRRKQRGEHSHGNKTS